MQTWTLLATIILYTLTAVGMWRQGKPGLALAFIAYAVANIGFIYEGLK